MKKSEKLIAEQKPKIKSEILIKNPIDMIIIKMEVPHTG